jgi:hypothetical protein
MRDSDSSGTETVLPAAITLGKGTQISGVQRCRQRALEVRQHAADQDETHYRDIDRQ